MTENTTKPFELCYQYRRAIVNVCDGGFSVGWLRDGAWLGLCWTASSEHAFMLASAWAWHAVPPRDAPTLTGMAPVEVWA